MTLAKESSCLCMSRTSCCNNYTNQCDTLVALLTWRYIGEDGEATANRPVIQNLTYYCLSYLCLRYKLCVIWFTLIIFDINCTIVCPDYFCCFKCYMCLKEPHRIAKSIRHTPVLFCFLAMIIVAVTLIKLFIFCYFSNCILLAG